MNTKVVVKLEVSPVTHDGTPASLSSLILLFSLTSPVTFIALTCNIAGRYSFLVVGHDCFKPSFFLNDECEGDKLLMDELYSIYSGCCFHLEIKSVSQAQKKRKKRAARNSVMSDSVLPAGVRVFVCPFHGSTGKSESVQ